MLVTHTLIYIFFFIFINNDNFEFYDGHEHYTVIVRNGQTLFKVSTKKAKWLIAGWHADGPMHGFIYNHWTDVSLY